MYQFILLIHVFVAVMIVGLVLLQQGKGAAVGAAFGSGASQTMFGSRGSGSFLYKLTMSFLLVFFITSIALNNLAMKAYKKETVISLPAIPAKQEPVNTVPAENGQQTESKQDAAPNAPASPGDQVPTRKR